MIVGAKNGDGKTRDRSREAHSVCLDVLMKEGSMVIFTGCMGNFFKHQTKVPVWLQAACFGRFDQALQSGCRVGTIGMAMK